MAAPNNMSLRQESKSVKKIGDGLILFALVSPIPLGGYHPAISSTLSAIILIAFAMVSYENLRGRFIMPVARGALRFAMWLVLIVLGWSFIQAAPLPAPLEGLAAGVFRDVSSITDLTGPVSISIDRIATIEGAITGTAYGAFLLCIAISVRGDRIRQAYTALCAVSVIVGIVAVGFDLAEIQRVLWIEKWIYHDVATGTFLHRNGYADYAGLGLIATAVIYLCASETSRPPRWITALCILSIAVNGLGLLLTESRAGIVCAAIGIVPMVLKWLSIRHVRPLQILIFVVIGAVLASVTVWMFIPRLMGRFGFEALLSDNRWALYRLAWRALMEAPLIGHGLSTFPSVYFQYLDQDLYEIYFRRAHSTYLEIAVDLGIPMALALITAAFIVIVMACRGLRKPGPEGIYAAAAFSATLLLGLHNLVDFTLQIPAIALTALMILGFGLSRRSA